MPLRSARLLDNMPPGDSLLLLEAGELEKRSKLRSLCENESKPLAAIACYAEEGAARQRVIADILQRLSACAHRAMRLQLARRHPAARPYGDAQRA